MDRLTRMTYGVKMISVKYQANCEFNKQYYSFVSFLDYTLKLNSEIIMLFIIAIFVQFLNRGSLAHACEWLL